MNPHTFAHAAVAAEIGAARSDITPPVGIPNRNWGAATGEVSTGVHRPLCATALAVGDLVLVTLDLGVWRRAEDELALRERILAECGILSEHLIVALSHTHSGPRTGASDPGPGADLTEAYQERLAASCVEAVDQARSRRRGAVLTWSTGVCDLARNRDLFDGSRDVCGFNPAGEQDTTLVVGRAVDDAGEIVAVIVNYACHPTTLAWQNSLVSPDSVGAMREVVEEACGGAPCLFVQGASGELGPRRQFTGAPRVADDNGRVLGHAVLSCLYGMLPPATALAYRGPVESGATLGDWEEVPVEVSRHLAVRRLTVDLPTKSREEMDETARRWATLPDPVRSERLRRRRHIMDSLERGATASEVWIWKIGDAVMVAQAKEAYSSFQRELRRRFGDRTLIVAGLCNGPSIGYLPDHAAYAHPDRYQVWQTPYAEGALERLTEETAAAVESLIATA